MSYINNKFYFKKIEIFLISFIHIEQHIKYIKRYSNNRHYYCTMTDKDPYSQYDEGAYDINRDDNNIDTNTNSKSRSKFNHKNQNTLPVIFEMMQNSKIMSLIYEYIIKNILAQTSDADFLKNKDNIRYVTLGICLLFATSLIGMLSYFLFYVMFFFSSIKL